MSGSDVNAFTLVLDLEKTLKELGVPARRLPTLLDRVPFDDGGADVAAERREHALHQTDQQEMPCPVNAHYCSYS
ncbi:hypothetical protein [Streptomyces canus]|uniref:hypothetical protein n=1 Tax=Streptomyces canus TaxID=58343 RepID=UPI003246474A